MKKLFTLIALLTCFLGAKAVQIVDAEVDFSKATSIHFYSWGGQGQEYFDLQDGCLHFHSDAATEVPWNVQVFPIGDVAAEEGITYTLELKIKGTGYQDNGENDPGSAVHNVNFQVGNANHDKYSAIPVTEDFEVVKIEFDCTATGTGNILFQCGSWVGDLWIEYMKIYHEGKEQKPVEWKNIIDNGDASAAWANPDMQANDQANGTVCAWGKEWGYLMNSINDAAGGASIPDPHPATIEDGVFVSHAKAVDPVLLYAEDGSNGWSSWSAGDEMADNTWQNQFWINFPRPMKDGESFKLSFKYKASKDISVPSQYHQEYPGNYLTGGSVGTLSFTTDWQTYEKELSASGNMQSIAFNLTGDGDNWREDCDFYFDDIEVSFMVLEEGYFVAYTDTEDGTPEYDFDTAIKFEEEGEDFVATVGGESEDEWVNQVMISTARGNDKGFKAATLKVSGAVKNDPENWMGYEESANAKINLPVRGMWKIRIANSDTESLMSFEKLAGEADKEEIVINPNTTEVVVKGQAKVENTWDNQFWIVANRDLEAGEETWLEFDYWLASEEIEEAKVTTQYQGEPSDWAANGATEDLTFKTEKQHFGGIVTIPTNKTQQGKAIKSIAFNMAEVPEAANYYITNVIWKLNDNTASLIDQEGTKPFWMVEGKDTPLHQFGVDPVQPAKKGDLNGDEKINGTDIQILINFIVDEEDYDENYDINGDGKINGTDIQELINIIVNEE